MAYMKCPKCGKAGLIREHKRKRLRDGAHVVVQVCHGCGWARNKSVVVSSGVGVDGNGQRTWTFATL